MRNDIGCLIPAVAMVAAVCLAALCGCKATRIYVADAERESARKPVRMEFCGNQGIWIPAESWEQFKLANELPLDLARWMEAEAAK
jgi:hypothetical protein